MTNEDPGPYELDYEFTKFSEKNRIHLSYLKHKRKEAVKRRIKRKEKYESQL